MKFERVSPVFACLDVKKALAAYEKLGFTVNVFDEGGQAIYGFMRRGDVELHIARVPHIDMKTTNACCYIYVDDADTLHAEWQTADPPGTLHPLRDTPYGLREFAFVDPDGNLMRIGSPR